MQFTLKIEVLGIIRDYPGEEIATILENLAARVRDASPADRDAQDPFVLRDTNGNTVGYAHFEEVPA